MIKNIFKKIHGFSPVELVIMVGFGALAAGALIFLATTPHYMASSQPINVNIKVDGSTASRQPAAKASGTCDMTKVVANSLNGFDITPTGTYPTDVTNVQCAVDSVTSGGTVVLKASPTYFNFGAATSPGSVLITNDVIIKGEKVSSKTYSLPSGSITSDKTVIYGGGSSTYQFPAAGAFSMYVKHALTVDGIRFENPAFTSIAFLASKDITIKNNVIKNVIPVDIGFGGLFSYGIVGTEIYSLFGLPCDINGTITVENNNIKLLPDTYPTIYAAPGIGFHDFSNQVKFVIKNNVLTNDTDGIFMASFPNGTALIDGNTITQNADGYNLPSELYGLIGISAIDHGYGFGVPGQTVISNNKITMAGVSGASRFTYGLDLRYCNDCTLKANQIKGKMNYGIFARFQDGTVISGDNLVQIELIDGTWQLDPVSPVPKAEVFLYFTNNSTLAGGGNSTLINLGTGNNVTGNWTVLDPYDFGYEVGKIGKDLSEGVRRWKKML